MLHNQIKNETESRNSYCFDQCLYSNKQTRLTDAITSLDEHLIIMTGITPTIYILLPMLISIIICTGCFHNSIHYDNSENICREAFKSACPNQREHLK